MSDAERKRVLVTVKAYPLPSRAYGELVCTAGFLEDGSWVRIYPVPYRFLRSNKYVAKYQWIELDLKRRSPKQDFRPESYRPLSSELADMTVGEKVGTGRQRDWAARRDLCLRDVYTSRRKLVEDAYAERPVSLATFRPSAILGLAVEEVEREWSETWQAQLRELDLFTPAVQPGTEGKALVPKLPYRFSYRFRDEDGAESKLMIEDWEIGALYWNCLRDAEGDEVVAVAKVRQKYESLAAERDVHLFLGTTLQYHRRKVLNPFVIVGVFYPPPPPPQLGLFGHT